MTNKYNGWTNYATWRVNLEIFDGLDPREMGWQRLDKYDLAYCLKEYANELIDMQGEGLAVDYARAFISDVNWQEIAQSMIEAYADEEADDCDDETSEAA
jgi:hypothetical protein